MIFLPPIMASLHFSLNSSFSALSARFLRPLGAKSGVGDTPQLHRPRALCTVRSRAARAAFLLRASAQTLFLRFFWRATEIAPIRRYYCTERFLTFIFVMARPCPDSTSLLNLQIKVFPIPRAAEMCWSVLCARSSAVHSQR